MGTMDSVASAEPAFAPVARKVQAWVVLRPGKNVVSLRVQTGATRFSYFAQRLELVLRDGLLGRPRPGTGD